MPQPPSQLSPEARYHRDPQFKAVVDVLRAQLRQARLTPTELREAATLAAVMHEMDRGLAGPVVVAAAVPCSECGCLALQEFLDHGGRCASCRQRDPERYGGTPEPPQHRRSPR